MTQPKWINNIFRYFKFYLPVSEYIFNAEFYSILFLDLKSRFSKL